MYDGPLQELIDALSRLPGIGPKGAQRIAFHILDAPAEEANELTDALREVKEKAKFCKICFNVSSDEVCQYCRDPRRDQSMICVVEESKDVIAVERTRQFRGLYHVLGGAISPLDGKGPADLHIRELCQRLADETVTEVILATNPNLEGEATATYRAHGRDGVPTSLWFAGWRRSGIRRRGHPGARLRGTPPCGSWCLISAVSH